MKKISELSRDCLWQMGCLSHGDLAGLPAAPVTAAEVLASGMPVYGCTLPSDAEQTLEAAGVIPELFYGRNIIAAQQLEYNHYFYFCTFYAEDPAAPVLCFEGIDTFAKVYVNGTLLAETDNMFLRHEIPLPGGVLKRGDNELLVHVIPALVGVRGEQRSPLDQAQKYNYDSLYTRKAAYMYGWDIFPRVVSAGIHKPVFLYDDADPRFVQDYLLVREIGQTTAEIVLFFELDLKNHPHWGYTVEVEGVCGDSRFSGSVDVWGSAGKLFMHVPDARLWWPRPMGEQNLYATTVRLKKDGAVVQEKQYEFGIRKIELLRTDTTDAGGSGKFEFTVNGRRMYVKGTNWVPLDSLPARAPERLMPALELVRECGCNMIRIWGGGYYEEPRFYHYCDRQGILVWQDFMMACGIYPRSEAFLSNVAREVRQVVRDLRQHACLALWSGDNENDASVTWGMRGFLKPDDNTVTRETIPEILKTEDFTRPYLPSSPYINNTAHDSGLPLPEDHLWGPRDYYKGAYYTGSPAHFASEMGYHGCPSAGSIEKFISPAFRHYAPDNPEWLLHASSPNDRTGEDYAYRIALMAKQIKVLFGEIPETLEEFVLASQLSQAEAMKFFVERFRIGKWRRTGLIWWNLIDGCPQFSDAVVDYYFEKKLAYHSIKASQQDVCIAAGEYEQGGHTLYGLNDLPRDVTVDYTVTDGSRTLLAGQAVLPADSTTPIGRISIGKDEVRILIFRWSGDACGQNHYLTGHAPYTFRTVVSLAKTAGLL